MGTQLLITLRNLIPNTKKLLTIQGLSGFV